MSLTNLENLVKTGQFKKESKNLSEFSGLLRSGETRLTDACSKKLALESRFDLAYNAAHSLALAALRWHGYRSNHRYLVFQVLPHTLGLGPEGWRVLEKCHHQRNLAEYEGLLDVNEQLVDALISATQILFTQVSQLQK